MSDWNKTIQRLFSEGLIDEVKPLEKNIAPDYVAEKGHFIPDDGRYTCSKCGVPQIDLTEDAMYGDVRECV